VTHNATKQRLFVFQKIKNIFCCHWDLHNETVNRHLWNKTLREMTLSAVGSTAVKNYASVSYNKPDLVAERSTVLVYGRSLAGSNPAGGMDGCPLWVLCVLSGRGVCDGLITRPEKSCRLWCVLVCDFGTSRVRRLKPPKGCKCRIEKKILITNVACNLSDMGAVISFIE
jgi:hypothetical protein